MPFKATASPEDYPERENPRRPWDEWGPQEQERQLCKALGEDLYRGITGMAIRRTDVPIDSLR